MKAWVLGDPGRLTLADKPVPRPGPAEVLVRVDACAICASDLEVISHGPPAIVAGGPPFNRNFTPGHEYMGTIAAVGPNVDEYAVGDRVAAEIHAGCGRCERCRHGMYTSCLNYGDDRKGHRANGFTTDGGFAQFAVNHLNTLVSVPRDLSDELATLIVTAGTAIYGLDVLGGLIAGQSLVVTGAGPIGLMVVGAAKALGASPVILTDVRDDRLAIGRKMGADHTVNASLDPVVDTVHRLNGGRGVHYVFECSGAPNAVNDAVRMVSRGGRVCLGAFAHQPVTVDVEHIVANNIYLYGIRGEGQGAVRRAAALMAQHKIDASPVWTHTFALDELPTGLRYARDRIDGAIKVVIKPQVLKGAAVAHAVPAFAEF